jgi:ribosomal protein S18 acetylase RimI-like enzyme
MRSGSHSISVGVPPPVVWNSLVAAARHEWYYRLTPQGAFAPGSRVEWMDVRGDLAEESEVVELQPPRVLELKTRFVFAPALGSAEPHSVRWEIAPAPGGSRITMTWTADGSAARLLESEGDLQLRGLRLEVDPAAREELERLPSVGPIAIREVTPERLGDYQLFFDKYGFADFPAWQSCYCIETHLAVSEQESSERTAADNRRDMSAAIGARAVTALLAYEGNRPVGWCNYGATTRLGGVMLRYGLEAAEYGDVGSVACFVVAAPYRGHGVATMLLDGALARLRDLGLRAVEAYPAKDPDSAQSAYRGPLSMYLRAGFEPYREAKHHVFVRKTL